MPGRADPVLTERLRGRLRAAAGWPAPRGLSWRALGSQVLGAITDRRDWRMRHLIGFILALATSAALFFGAGWGVTELSALHGPGGGIGPAHALTSLHGIGALVAVVGTGLLIGLLLAVPWFSPLGTGLPGLVLLGWTGLFVAHSGYTLRYLPLAGSSFANGIVFLLTHGILGLAGAAMIIPMFVPSRWHRAAYYAEDDEEEDLSVPAAIGLVP